MSGLGIDLPDEGDDVGIGQCVPHKIAPTERVSNGNKIEAICKETYRLQVRSGTGKYSTILLCLFCRYNLEISNSNMRQAG